MSELAHADAVGTRTEGLHDRYSSAVLGYCIRRLRSREEAEDAAQIVFLTAHRCLARGVEPRLEQAWLFKIAEHVVLHRRRTISRRARVEYPVDIGDVAHLAVTPEIDVRPEILGLAEALSGIPPLQQRALVLREWHGLSYREVAAELGVSHSTAGTLIFRGRRDLAHRLRGQERDAGAWRRLGFSAPSWLSLKGLLAGGTLLKAVAGATTVAVVAVTVHHALPALAPVAVLVTSDSRAVAVLPAAGIRDQRTTVMARPSRVVFSPVRHRSPRAVGRPVQPVGAPMLPIASGDIPSSPPSVAVDSRSPAEPAPALATVPPPAPRTAGDVVAVDLALTDAGTVPVSLPRESWRAGVGAPDGPPSFAHDASAPSNLSDGTPAGSAASAATDGDGLPEAVAVSSDASPPGPDGEGHSGKAVGLHEPTAAFVAS